MATRQSSPELRRKVFGLNAAVPYGIDQEEIRMHTANDQVSTERLAYRENPDPSFLTYGPKTRREFMNFLAWGRLGERSGERSGDRLQWRWTLAGGGPCGSLGSSIVAGFVRYLRP